MRGGGELSSYGVFEAFLHKDRPEGLNELLVNPEPEAPRGPSVSEERDAWEPSVLGLGRVSRRRCRWEGGRIGRLRCHHGPHGREPQLPGELPERGHLYRDRRVPRADGAEAGCVISGSADGRSAARSTSRRGRDRRVAAPTRPCDRHSCRRHALDGQGKERGGGTTAAPSGSRGSWEGRTVRMHEKGLARARSSGSRGRVAERRRRAARKPPRRDGIGVDRSGGGATEAERLPACARRRGQREAAAPRWPRRAVRAV